MESWNIWEPSNKLGEDCLSYLKPKFLRGSWFDDCCDLQLPFICLIASTATVAEPPIKASGNHTLLMKKKSTSSRISFQFWWSHLPSNDLKRAAGFQIKWRSVKRRNPGNQGNFSPGKHTIQTHSKEKTPTGEREANPWKPRNAKWSMVNLATTSRLQNKTEDLRRVVFETKMES